MHGKVAPVLVRKTRHHGKYRSLTARDNLQEASLLSPRQLQRMMLKLQRYQFSVPYRKGKELYLANTLSRAPVTYHPSTTSAMKEYEVFLMELAEMDIELDRVTSETMQ